MNKTKRFRWQDPGLIVDSVQILIALLAAIALALDTTGIINLPWLKDNLIELSFVAICTLIIATSLERRSTLRSYQKVVETRLERIDEKASEIRDGLSGKVSADLVLTNRKGYTRPIEERIENAKQVDVSGITLVAFITNYDTLFLKHAKRGCKFRFIMIDPQKSTSSKSTDNVRKSVEIIDRLRVQAPGQFEVRLLSSLINSSILMIDSSDEMGEIQVGSYAR